MLSENQKRKASLSVLEKLRQQGAPGRGDRDGYSMGDEESELNDMFARLDEEGKVVSGGELSDEGKASKEKDKEKKRPPNLIPSGVEAMKAAFRKQK